MGDARLLEGLSSIFYRPGKKNSPEAFLREGRDLSKAALKSPSYATLLKAMELIKRAIMEGDGRVKQSAQVEFDAILKQFDAAATRIFPGSDKFDNKVLPHLKIRPDEFKRYLSNFNNNYALQIKMVLFVMIVARANAGDLTVLFQCADIPAIIGGARAAKSFVNSAVRCGA